MDQKYFNFFFLLQIFHLTKLNCNHLLLLIFYNLILKVSAIESHIISLLSNKTKICQARLIGKLYWTVFLYYTKQTYIYYEIECNIHAVRRFSNQALFATANTS